MTRWRSEWAKTSPRLLPAFQSQSIPTPPFIASRDEEPQTADPAKYHTDPGLRRTLEQCDGNKLECASWNRDKGRRQWRRRLDKQQSA